MLHGYCVRRGGDPAPAAGLAGVDAAPVRALADAGLSIWVSDGADPRPTLERVRAHDRVVRAALRTATPVPLRYGARFPDEAEARATLRDRAQELLATLERLGDRVEMALHARWTQPPAPPEPLPVRSGREYLEARRREMEASDDLRREAEETARRIELAFTPIAPETTREILPEEGVAVAVAHLVQRSQLHRYAACVEDARAALPQMEIRASGPWAPYSFV